MNKIELFNNIKVIINEWDPVSLLELGAWQEEYDIEISKIAGRIRDESDINDISNIVYDVFIEMFDKDTFNDINSFKQECIVIAEKIYSKIIRNKYINIFISDLAYKDKENFYDEFIWNAFLYKDIEKIEGKDAIVQFKKIENNSVYIFFQNNDNVLEKENLTYEELINIIREDIWNNIDCYVVDKEFKWTFVCTHETYIPNYFELIEEEDRDFEAFPSIGPFFIKNSRK